MPRARRARYRRARKTWSSSSEESACSELDRQPSLVREERGWRSLPGTPEMSKDPSLLKMALNKAVSIEEWIQGIPTTTTTVDSRLMATFPTFHSISVASGSPAGVRRRSGDASGKAFTHPSPQATDSQVSKPEGEGSSSSMIGESSDAGKEDLRKRRRKKMSPSRERMSKGGKSVPGRRRNVRGREGMAAGWRLSDSEGEITFFPKESDGRVRAKIFATGNGKRVHHDVSEGKRNVSDFQKSQGGETRVAGEEIDILKLENSGHGRDESIHGEERGSLEAEKCIQRTTEIPGRDKSVRKRERIITRVDESDSDEKDDWRRDGSHTRRKCITPGKEGSLLQTGMCANREEINLSEKVFSIPECGRGEGGVSCRNRGMIEEDSGLIRRDRLDRDGSYSRKAMDGQENVVESDKVGKCMMMQPWGHSTASTRVLLDLIQELETNLALESDVEIESNEATWIHHDITNTHLWPQEPSSGYAVLASGGVCLNVTRRPKTRPRAIDHLNSDSVLLRGQKGLSAPSDFLVELTQILDRKLCMIKATEEPPSHLDPDDEFWGYVKSSGAVDPLKDDRFRVLLKTAKEFRFHRNLFTFALTLIHVDCGECEPDLEEDTPSLEVEGEGEGLAEWLQKAEPELLPAGVEWSTMDSSTCLELALEGERLCKAGDCRAGVAFFEAAIQTGTDDLRTLSAIYSQLGNAYFYLGEYDKAMEYHKLDLTVARTMGDRLGVAKASGNLGNTLKVMGKFKEAICCCERHLSISQELQDKVGEGRALYNLGNVYHAQGKHLGRIGPQEPGGFSDEVKHCLQKAVEYYAANLRLMEELNDRSAQGRACGNLGNTHYLLGNFTQAISYHNERLAIAKEFGDKAAERRAHSNLGNAHIFLGEFETAAEHYKKTLQLAQELGDRAVEAQACYSLGNTYTLLRDYPMAIHYHLRHLAIAEELTDKVGEGRACWSLGNAYSATNNNEKALHYATRHLEISKEIGDKTGQAAAQMNLSDIRKVLGLPPTATDSESSESAEDAKSRTRRKSMENMDLLKMTPDAKGVLRKYQSEDAGIGSMSSDDSHPVNGPSYNTSSRADKNASVNEESSMDDDSFFELLSRFQSKRMDDQRCTLSIDSNKENQPEQAQQQVPCHREGGSISSDGSTNGTTTPSDSGANNCGVLEELMESIAGMQSRRMDEQRASLPQLPGLNNQHAILQRLSVAASDSTPLPDDNFFDMLMRCQGSRIEDQRSSLPNEGSLTHSAPTVPDDDFFSLIMRFQSGRLEDQRSTMPLEATRNSTHPTTDEEDPPSSAQSTGTKDGLVSRLVKGRK